MILDRSSSESDPARDDGHCRHGDCSREGRFGRRNYSPEDMLSRPFRGGHV
jgi:hypothetical protein